MYHCDCGEDCHNQSALIDHQRKCKNRSMPCTICDTDVLVCHMNDHLLMCGNKTEKCPKCSKYIRRAIYKYHLDNNCIDWNEDNIYRVNNNNDSKQSSSTCVEASVTVKNAFNMNYTIDEKETEIKFESNIKSHLKSSSAVGPKHPNFLLHRKVTDVEKVLSKDFNQVEVHHVLKQLQFNILISGSPRVGKSQLINALCGEENLAKTSSSLNSCTQEVTCYELKNNQQQIPGVKTYPVYIYDTPGIESWTNETGRATIMNFIEQTDPVCFIYCAAPGTFADLKQLRFILEFCKERKIFCALVCTDMWRNTSRKEVLQDFEKELRFFGDRKEEQFEQEHDQSSHAVIHFGNGALCTMVNSKEYRPEFSDMIKPVQGIEELILSIMKRLDGRKLIGWCTAVLYRRSYLKRIKHKVGGFLLERLKNLATTSSDEKNIIPEPIAEYAAYLLKKYQE